MPYPDVSLQIAHKEYHVSDTTGKPFIPYKAKKQKNVQLFLKMRMWPSLPSN